MTEDLVARTTQKPSNIAGRVIVINGQLLRQTLSSLADAAHAALSGVQLVVLPSLQAVRLEDVRLM